MRTVDQMINSKGSVVVGDEGSAAARGPSPSGVALEWRSGREEMLDDGFRGGELFGGIDGVAVSASETFFVLAEVFGPRGDREGLPELPAVGPVTVEPPALANVIVDYPV